MTAWYLWLIVLVTAWIAVGTLLLGPLTDSDLGAGIVVAIAFVLIVVLAYAGTVVLDRFGLPFAGWIPGAVVVGSLDMASLVGAISNSALLALSDSLLIGAAFFVGMTLAFGIGFVLGERKRRRMSNKGIEQSATS